ncbi:hypothetical protein [Nostoc sp. FACHB-133]|uniref:hypothetical protein n=1 Tax=Nostoc sp. FACHB-133 TaxID=2692835 RepID=UPI001687398A|nr:hypothetical protein [Nostoc sp. FACHB-133]
MGQRKVEHELVTSETELISNAIVMTKPPFTSGEYPKPSLTPGEPEPQVGEYPKPSLTPGDPQEREYVRKWLAYSLMAIFGVTILSSLIFVFINPFINAGIDKKDNDNRAKDFLTLILTSEVGLIGAALGFYFGEKNKST